MYDPAYNHLIPTGALTAQQAGFTGLGINVGIMDSGVDPATPPMQGKVAWFKSYLPGGSQSPNDTSGHGTVVADILGGSAAGTLPADNNKPFPGGVAPGAKLYFEQVCTSAGSGSCAIGSANYNDFVAQNVRIINGSFGSGNAQTEFTGPGDPNIPAVQAAFQPAVNAGILQVWAAGSSGAAQPWDQAGLPYWIPSFQPSWLAVVNVAIDSYGKPAGLYMGSDAPSNACGIAAQWCLGAPGEVEFPSVPGQFAGGFAHGSSASAAVVSGVAAQVLQAFPWMSAANLTDTILTTATPLDDGSHQTPNPTYGWGMVNAAKAVNGPAQFAFGDFNANLPAGTTATFGNSIGGSGGLILSGQGKLTLAGANNYSGDTTISTGSTLALTNIGRLSSFHGVTVDGTFDLSGTNVPGSVSPGATIIQSLSGAGAVILGTNYLVLTNASGNFSGVISGSGNFELQIGGTEVLSGTNTYTGQTQIVSGTLALAGNGSIATSSTVVINDGASLDISGTNNGAKITNLYGGGSVVLGAQTLTLIGTGPTSVYDGVISGTGGVTISSGTMGLADANTYTGPTTIAAGASLALVDGPTGGMVAGNVLDNGSLDFQRSGDVTYGGVVSGSGSLTQEGLGTLRLTGANTFTGGLKINNGTLVVSGNVNLGASSGGVILNGGTLENTASFTLAPILSLGPSLVSIIQTDANTTLTIPNAISGLGALTKTGPGTLVLDGVSTYSGNTGVLGGVLQATHPLPGNTTIGSGATLDAVPGVGGYLESAGTVAVHGGDTTVSGNYIQGSGATLAVSLGSKLVVTGTAALSSPTQIGGTLEVTGADSGYVANTHTDVLTATGGVTGTFSQLVKDTGVVFTSTTIGYGPNDVYLDTTGLSITAAAAAMGIVAPAAVSAAQRVQVGFEAINGSLASGGALSPGVLQGAGAIQQSATPAVAQVTLTSLSGQLHAASAAMLFDGIDAGSNALSEHFDDLVSGRAKSGVWYSDLGWQGNLQRSGYAGATFRSGGGMAGADMSIGSHALLGFAAGQSLGFGQLDASWDHNRTWMNNIAMYGGLVNGPWYASAQLANGWYREDMQRLLQLGALGSPVGTASTGRYLAGALEGGRQFQFGATRVVPFADVRYQRLDLGGFSEQGGLGYGLKAGSRTAGRLQAGLGLRAERGWQLANGMRLEWDGSAGWQHTLHQYGSVFEASFTGFNDWLPVEGIGLSRNATVLRAGLSLWPTRNFGLHLGYTGEQGQRERAGSVMLQGAVAF